MKLFFTASIATILTSINPAYSMQTQSMHGGTGLGMMRTAEIIDAGSAAWYVNTQINAYDSTITAGDSAEKIKIDFGYLMPLSQSAELGFSVPVSHYTPDTASGNATSDTGDLQAIFKYNFLRPEGINKSGFSATFFSGLTTSDSDIGSGNRLFGAEINMSHYFDAAAVHANFGMKRDDVFTGALNAPFVDQDLLTASLGLESEISPATVFSLQGIAEVNIDDRNKNLLVSASLTHAFSSNLILTLGGVFGAPQDRSNPNNALLLGITYSPGSKMKLQKDIIPPTVDNNINDYRDSQLDAALEKVGAMEERLDVLETQLTEQAMTLATSPQEKSPIKIMPAEILPADVLPSEIVKDDRLTVEIIVPAGRPNYRYDLGRYVDKEGYVITHTSTKNSAQKTSHIYYRHGLADEAVSLGEKLNGDQNILTKSLPEGIDIQILLGTDLLE